MDYVVQSVHFPSTSSYVLLTAAYNEEALISRTIESVVAQTILPSRWVVISDGSTDATDEIVENFSKTHSFIHLVRVEPAVQRGVARKVNALRVGYLELEGLKYDFIGNLDADISFDSEYFATLITRFKAEPTLGICGGMIYEESRGKFRPRLSNSPRSVAHAAQLMRRECYEAIGGYSPLEFGGEDWCSEIAARMRGWRVQACPDLKVLHFRRTGSADHIVRHAFRQGRMDFSVGSHPLFELLKCVRRLPESPFLLGAGLRLAGYCWSWISRQPQLVPPEVTVFLRCEQKQRLGFLFRRSFMPKLRSAIHD